MEHKNDRYYSYIVEVSEDGQTFELAVDRHENKEKGKVVHSLDGAIGRFVRITVLSCSDKAGYAVIHDQLAGSATVGAGITGLSGDIGLKNVVSDPNDAVDQTKTRVIDFK